MDRRHLQTFRAVLRERSFRGAARALRLAQPTVTLRMQELEEEFGLLLFDRHGRKRQPTLAGKLFAERSLPILDSLDALERSMAELRDGSTGFLRIGSIEPAASQRLTPLLARLRRRRPGLRVHLNVGGTGGVSRAVADGDLDFGLCSAPPLELGLQFEPLFQEEMVLLVPQSHRLARRGLLRARDLDREPLLLTEQGCAYRGAVESALGRRGVRAQWALESGSTATLREAVRRNLGIAVLPRPAVMPPPPGTVVRRLKDLLLALPVGIVRRSEAAPAPPALAALVADLRRDLPRSAGIRLKGARRIR